MAVSALSIQGYASQKSYSGGGIYGSHNNFSLNTNTVVLFAFVLAVAFVVSWIYFTMARAFTKQFICESVDGFLSSILQPRGSWLLISGLGITGILNIVIGVGTAVYYFLRHYYSAAIVFAIFSVFTIICFVRSQFLNWKQHKLTFNRSVGSRRSPGPS